MKHRVHHNLGPETARKAADGAWASYQERFAKYSPVADWTSSTHADIKFTVKGFSLKGSLDLESDAIAMDLDVPLPLRLFKKKAISIIETEIRVWIKKAETGEI